MVFAFSAQAQRFYTKSAQISFSSDGNSEKIEAVNNKVNVITDVKSGALEFAALMKAFSFEKALMEEHFNENYVESDKFPKATFKGAFVEPELLLKTGKHATSVTGILTIHGVSKDITASVEIIVSETKIGLSSAFTILLSDYKVEIPAIVEDNINNEVKVKVNASLLPLKR
jgi:hypothetical protein